MLSEPLQHPFNVVAQVCQQVPVVGDLRCVRQGDFETESRPVNTSMGSRRCRSTNRAVAVPSRYRQSSIPTTRGVRSRRATSELRSSLNTVSALMAKPKSAASEQPFPAEGVPQRAQGPTIRAALMPASQSADIVGKGATRALAVRALESTHLDREHDTSVQHGPLCQARVVAPWHLAFLRGMPPARLHLGWGSSFGSPMTCLAAAIGSPAVADGRVSQVGILLEGIGRHHSIKSTKALIYRTAFGKAKRGSLQLYSRCAHCKLAAPAVRHSPECTRAARAHHPQWAWLQCRYASVMSYRHAQIYQRRA